MNDSSKRPQLRASSQDELTLSFDGRLREYFRVWLVAKLLTLATAGIFMPWAEIRTQRFLWAHTRLGTTPFEYKARPLDVFKKQLVVSILPAAWSFALGRAGAAGSTMFAVWALAWPWLIAYDARFQGSTTWHAERHIEVSAGYAHVLRALLLPFGLCFALLVPVGVGLGAQHSHRVFWLGLALAFLFVSVPLLIAATRVLNTIWRTSRLGSLRFVPDFRLRDALWGLANNLLVIASCGLLSPCAELRNHRYRLSRLRLVAAEPEPAPELSLDRTWA